MVTGVLWTDCYGVAMSKTQGGLQSGWKALRGNYWGSLAFDVVLMILVFVGINAWQTRDLPNDDYKPPLESFWLDDMQADEVFVAGQTGVVYFFAPWCFYCRHSINNLEELVASGEVSWARAVALEYDSVDDVREFIRDTGVSFPVLLGSSKTTQDWQIRAFPTYFVIDGNGQIVSRSVGYSTKIGMKARAWLNRD
jgi:thiol-disulfide isomerase/thioredoxin